MGSAESNHSEPGGERGSCWWYCVTLPCITTLPQGKVLLCSKIPSVETRLKIT
ncbi:hypothetical protein PAHAL_6G287800 [Panicum hallii]|uniref:Uncharacterized protein n=1 Tax=Panicum hallii TaxID=206008 RepID=A0A2T8II05_9POAL|nr:hypothetical protein PAHAL_6G287800 [Panicum hallii]